MTRITTLYIFSMLVLVLLLAPCTVNADPLKNRSQLGIRIGTSFLRKDPVSNYTGGISSSTGTGNLVAGVNFARWFKENMAVTINILLLENEVANSVGWPSGVSNRVNSVVSLMFGLRYYPSESTLHTPYRPYLAFGAGTLIWSGSLNEVGSFGVVNRNGTMTVFGGHFGGGLDIVLSRRLLLGMNLGYNLMSNFSEIKAGANNYSSFQFCLGFGFLWGKGVQ